MRLRVSLHARRQAQRRGIPEETLISVATRPEQTQSVRKDREVRQSRVVFPEREEPFLVRVVVDLLPDEELIVTAYRTSRIAKYWSPR